jgi:tetratricopeptide (TPR) repeat protein
MKYHRVLQWVLSCLLGAVAALANAQDRSADAFSGSTPDLNGAIAEYSEIVHRTPDDPVAHFNLGRAFYAKHDEQHAIAQFREALRLKPDLLDAHERLADALHDDQDLDGAMARWRNTVKSCACEPMTPRRKPS